MKKRIALFALVLFIIIAPVALSMQHSYDLRFLISSLVLSLPVAFLVLAIRKKGPFAIALSVLLVGSLTEITIMECYGSFLLSGNIVAFFSTNPQETSNFVKSNWSMFLFYVPVVIAFFLALALKRHTSLHIRFELIGLALSVLLAAEYFSLGRAEGLENNVLIRPPYNFFYQLRNAVKNQGQRHYIKQSRSFEFNSERDVSGLPEKEIYVLGIGESMTYGHLSLNGSYPRETTPRLDTTRNVVMYSNYHCGACVTCLAVPQIVTRATPEHFELSFKEKAIFQPYKECGFKTYAVVCNNLLGQPLLKYLCEDVDSLINVSSDADVPKVIDSLSVNNPKMFIVTQFLGCHSYYYNYTPEFDKYRPNINSDPKVRSDSLYINAYDNTVLYADYVMSGIISTIDKPDVCSAFLFVSDHGENLGPDGGGHGTTYNPQDAEYHVPFITWHSDTYSKAFPQKVTNLNKHKDRPVCCDNVFYTVCDLSGIRPAEQYWDSSYSVLSDDFAEHDRLLLLSDGINSLLK